MKAYSVSLEISGLYAIWTRPDTGDCPVSYPAPTRSAARGIFESVLWGPAIEVIPTSVEICSPVCYKNYLTNYGGPLRKTEAVEKGNGYQLLATVLTDICYKLHAEVRPLSGNLRGKLPEKAVMWDNKTTSPGHAYKAIFERRLKRGQCYSIPFLGWKEFVPNYLGGLRSETKPCEDVNIDIPSMTKEVFSGGYNSDVDFTFYQNLKIRGGILVYPVEDGVS